MRSLELDKWDIQRLYALFQKGRLSLNPDYQRGRVWDDHRRYHLIDTMLQNWPMGLIMLRAYQIVNSDNVTLEGYDVVDGQQRLRTIFEYLGGAAPWSVKSTPKLQNEGFKPYKQLSHGQQTAVDEYKIAVALLKEYEIPEIEDIYSRLQAGKPLRIGERIKAQPSQFREYVRELASHKLFNLGKHTFRDSNWNLATQFLKACYSGNPLERVEFNELLSFLKSPTVDHPRAKKAAERASKIMNYELKTLNEAINNRPAFEEDVSSARTLKWLFAVLMQIFDLYSLAGREHLVAQGVLGYFDAKAVQVDSKTGQPSPEWVAYLASGRTGRMDTDDVKVCLTQLVGYIINATEAVPLDTQRWFTQEQRIEIWAKSGGKCQTCGIQLSPTNFHADHIKPHSEGGLTTVENGQALCAACNSKKGKDVLFPVVPLNKTRLVP